MYCLFIQCVKIHYSEFFLLLFTFPKANQGKSFQLFPESFGHLSIIVLGFAFWLKTSEFLVAIQRRRTPLSLDCF